MSAVWVLFGIFIVWAIWAVGRYPRDDTDSTTERSGMVLYTDHKTGVQYVGTIFGGITPRLDATGKPYTQAK